MSCTGLLLPRQSYNCSTVSHVWLNSLNLTSQVDVPCCLWCAVPFERGAWVWTPSAAKQTTPLDASSSTPSNRTAWADASNDVGTYPAATKTCTAYRVPYPIGPSAATLLLSRTYRLENVLVPNLYVHCNGSIATSLYCRSPQSRAGSEYSSAIEVVTVADGSRQQRLRSTRVLCARNETSVTLSGCLVRHEMPLPPPAHLLGTLMKMFSLR